MEISNIKSFANNSFRCVRRLWNAVSGNMGRFHQSAIKLLKFLVFREEQPKHQVVKNLHPVHALLVFYFNLLVPSIVFFWLIPMGFLVAFAGEVIVVLAVLETMHCLYDA